MRLIRSLGKDDPAADNVDVESLKSKLPPLDPSRLAQVVHRGRGAESAENAEQADDAKPAVGAAQDPAVASGPSDDDAEPVHSGEPRADEDVQTLPATPATAELDANLGVAEDTDIVWDEEEVLAAAPTFTPKPPPPPPPPAAEPEPQTAPPVPAASSDDTYWSALEQFAEGETAPSGPKAAAAPAESEKPARRRRGRRRREEKAAEPEAMAAAEPRARSKSEPERKAPASAPAEKKSEPATAARRRAVDVPKPIEDADEDYFGAGVLEEVDVFTPGPEAAGPAESQEVEATAAAGEPGAPAAAAEVEAAETAAPRRRRRRRRRKSGGTAEPTADAEVAAATGEEGEDESAGDGSDRYADVVTWPALIATLVGRGDSRNGKSRSGRGRRRRRR